MKKTVITALSMCIVFGISSCGSFGKPDPNTISEKNPGDNKVTTKPVDLEPDKAESSQSENSSDDSAESKADTSAADSEKEIEVIPQPYTPEDDMDKFVESVLDKMTLEEKIGQLFIVRPDALELEYENNVINDDEIGGVTYVDQMMEVALNKYHVGGIMLYEKNVVDEKQLTKLTADLQDKSEFPLFIAAEEIGGKYACIGNNVNFNVGLFPNNNEIGKTGSAEQARSMGKSIGTYLDKYGVNLDLAPVADISHDEEKTVEKNFSFEPMIAANLVSAEIEGLHEGGVMTAVKYFPGYGDFDPADEYICSNENSWEYLLDNDIIPFAEVMDDTDMIMVGHISLPNVTEDGLPASMSSEFINDKLRDELGYDGVVMTDTLSAEGIRNNFVQRECSLDAILAGADIVLCPYDLAENYDSVLQAVKDGKIGTVQIDERVRRILKLNAENGLFGQ